MTIISIIKDEYDTFDGYVDALEDRVAELEGNEEALHGLMEAKDRRISSMESAISSSREKGDGMAGFYADGWRDGLRFVHQSLTTQEGGAND